MSQSKVNGLDGATHGSATATRVSTPTMNYSGSGVRQDSKGLDQFRGPQELPLGFDPSVIPPINGVADLEALPRMSPEELEEVLRSQHLILGKERGQ